MKYKIEKHEEHRFLIHLTTDVEDVMLRLTKETEEDFHGMTPMGLVHGKRLLILPKKNLEGVEEISQISRYSFMLLVGKAFDNLEVVKGVMTKLDCDIEMDDSEFETSIETVEQENKDFLDDFKALMQKSLDEQEDKDNP